MGAVIPKLPASDVQFIFFPILPATEAGNDVLLRRGAELVKGSANKFVQRH